MRHSISLLEEGRSLVKNMLTIDEVGITDTALSRLHGYLKFESQAINKPLTLLGVGCDPVYRLVSTVLY